VPVFSLGPLLGPPLSGRGRTELPSVYDLPYRIDTSSGSAAIALALTAAGVDAGDEVLVPAYHCLSMVEPVRAVSAVPVYYRLHPNLSLNLQDLAARITPRTRAVLV